SQACARCMDCIVINLNISSNIHKSKIAIGLNTSTECGALYIVVSYPNVLGNERFITEGVLNLKWLEANPALSAIVIGNGNVLGRFHLEHTAINAKTCIIAEDIVGSAKHGENKTVWVYSLRCRRCGCTDVLYGAVRDAYGSSRVARTPRAATVKNRCFPISIMSIK